MNKTLHQKLSGKTSFKLAARSSWHTDEQIFTGLIPEMKILQQAEGDLLSPRPEAIDLLLKLSRELN